MAKNKAPPRSDRVALLTDLPALRLVRGQVGTIVQEIDSEIVLVEFTDDKKLIVILYFNYTA